MLGVIMGIWWGRREAWTRGRNVIDKDDKVLEEWVESGLPEGEDPADASKSADGWQISSIQQTFTEWREEGKRKN